LPDRIAADAEDDWDRRRCVSRRVGHGGDADRCDHIDLAADKVGGKPGNRS